MSPRPRRAVVVVGMHRSGTSAISGILGNLGVFMGRSLYGPQKGVNEKGFWENAAIVAMNEKLLDALLWSWDAPHAHAIEGFADEMHVLRDHGGGALSLLKREYGGSEWWGFKDPRVSILLPFWQEVLHQMDVLPAHLVMVRHPLAVAASLARRDRFSESKSLHLWLNYTLSSYWRAEGKPLMILDFDALLADPPGRTREVCDWLGLPIDQAAGAAAFVSPELRHQRAEGRGDEPPRNPLAGLATSVHQELGRRPPDPAVLRRLTDEYLASLARLDPVLREHLDDVKSDEVRYRTLFEEAYGSVWWKVSYPLRWLERRLRSATSAWRS